MLMVEHGISGVERMVVGLMNGLLIFYCFLIWNELQSTPVKHSFTFLPLDPFASIAFRTWFCFLRKCISEVRELCCSEPWIKTFAEPINTYIKDDLWVISRSLEIKLSRQEQFKKLQKNMLRKIFLPYIFWRLSLQTERQFRLMPSNPKPCITSTSHCRATITKIAKLSLAVFTYQLKFQQGKMQEYFMTLLFFENNANCTKVYHIFQFSSVHTLLYLMTPLQRTTRFYKLIHSG